MLQNRFGTHRRIRMEQQLPRRAVPCLCELLRHLPRLRQKSHVSHESRILIRVSTSQHRGHSFSSGSAATAAIECDNLEFVSAAAAPNASGSNQAAVGHSVTAQSARQRACRYAACTHSSKPPSRRQSVTMSSLTRSTLGGCQAQRKHRTWEVVSESSNHIHRGFCPSLTWRAARWVTAGDSASVVHGRVAEQLVVLLLL